MKISNRTFALLFALILAACLAAAAILWLNRPEGAKVLVTVNGQEYGTYELNKNQTVVISPEDGSWHNTLEIQDGKANVTESDCDNQICVMTPALREDTIGIIVCLPHGVAVELK